MSVLDKQAFATELKNRLYDKLTEKDADIVISELIDLMGCFDIVQLASTGNDKEYFSKDAVGYWQNVDLYVGGAEHGTGHLIYARFWNKFLFDIGMSVKEEPFQKLVNQGMIQGRSNFVYRSKEDNKLFISKNLIKDADSVTPIHVDINIVDNDVLDIERFRAWRPEFADARFELEDGKYICGWEIEKMSKSMFNVQNPDDLVAKYGADTLRMYEMFLGPVEQAKPWDTNGIEGVFRFFKKFWRLYHDENNQFCVVDADSNATNALCLSHWQCLWLRSHRISPKSCGTCLRLTTGRSAMPNGLCLRSIIWLRTRSPTLSPSTARCASPLICRPTALRKRPSPRSRPLPSRRSGWETRNPKRLFSYLNALSISYAKQTFSTRKGIADNLCRRDYTNGFGRGASQYVRL